MSFRYLTFFQCLKSDSKLRHLSLGPSIYNQSPHDVMAFFPFQIMNYNESEPFDYGWIGIMRSPRPLIFARVFRLLLTEKLPTARISQIIKYVGMDVVLLRSGCPSPNFM